MATYFGNYTEIALRREDVLACAHQGRCDDDVAATVSLPYVAKQLDAMSAADIALELKEYGAWNEDELSDEDANRERFLWTVAFNIREERGW